MVDFRAWFPVWEEGGKGVIMFEGGVWVWGIVLFVLYVLLLIPSLFENRVWRK